MSLYVIFDTALKTWEFSETETLPVFDFEFHFVQNGGFPVEFDNLSFGFAASNQDGILQSATYPAPGMVYLSSDQPFLTTDRVNANAGDNIDISVWVQNAGERHESNVSFTIPPWPEDN